MKDSIFARWSGKIMDDILEMVKTSFIEIIDIALEQSVTLLEESIEDLKKWIEQLSTGKITQKDFEWLIKSRVDLAELIFFKQVGLSLAEMDRFKKALLEVLYGSVKYIA